jgi:hypothetical protein
LTDFAVTKIVEDGRVYAQRSFEGGNVVLEKVDPRITHDAPVSVASGSSVTITFSIVDFDGAQRADSGGILSLEVEGTDVPLTITNGKATLEIELFASATVKQQPPYFCDARLDAFTIEVTS